MTPRREIVVIGAGPAGVEAARAAAQAGAAVTLLSHGQIGGRAGWHSLLPSKAWLTAADRLGELRQAASLGLAVPDEAVPADVAPAEVLARLRQVKAAWHRQQQTALEAAGVQIRYGAAAFMSPTVLGFQEEQSGLGSPAEGAAANGKRTAVTKLTADAFIVATGSVPLFPPAMRPDGRRVLAPRFASALSTLPDSIIVVGAGATGTEFVYLFNRLGVAVTWIVDQFGVLPQFDAEATAVVTGVMTSRGVRVVAGQMAARIEDLADGVAVILMDGSRYEAAAAFLAMGRRPDVADLQLDNAGLAQDGPLALDAYGRSSRPHIYFVGDVSGAPMMANRAMMQGRTAGRHAAGLATAPWPEAAMVQAIYSEPQLAQVGRLDDAGLETVRAPYDAVLKGRLLSQAGFIKLAYRPENRQMVGGAAVGPHAADLLAPVSVGIAAGMSIADFGDLQGAHPSLTELAFAAARRAG